jgi:Cu+-exporting ATPase
MIACAVGARNGVLIKNASGLESAKRLDTLVVDKTGTITEGKLAVSSITSSLSDEEFMLKAQTLASHSNHPISKAIVEYETRGEIVTVKDFKNHSGKGLSGGGYLLGSLKFLESMGVSLKGFDFQNEKGVICALAKDEKFLGIVSFSDPIKKDSKKAVEKLHSLGKEVYLLSGDRKAVVETVSKTLEMDGFFAEVLPEEKAQIVEEFQTKNKVVGMVGDGINDAIALAKSDVGFAIAEGTDVAMENAEIGLMRSNLSSLVFAIELSNKTFLKIRQNLFFAFFYNCAGVPLAALGLLNPMIAGLAMALSSISVVLNSITLRKTSQE